MAVRLRPVLLVAAVALGLLVAFPHVASAPQALTTRAAAGTVAAPAHGLGSCAPGTQRCDPSAPVSSLFSSLWTGMTFVAALIMIGGIARWTRRSPSRRPLAAGVVSGLERPPRPLTFAG